MKLFKITEIHFSQKDSHESHHFAIANSEGEILGHLAAMSSWQYAGDDETQYDEDSDSEIPFMDWVVKNRGDLKDEPTDLYYGATLRGWGLGVPIDSTQLKVLLELDLVKDLRT